MRYAPGHINRRGGCAGAMGDLADGLRERAMRACIVVPVNRRGSTGAGAAKGFQHGGRTRVTEGMEKRGPRHTTKRSRPSFRRGAYTDSSSPGPIVRWTSIANPMIRSVRSRCRGPADLRGPLWPSVILRVDCYQSLNRYDLSGEAAAMKRLMPPLVASQPPAPIRPMPQNCNTGHTGR